MFSEIWDTSGDLEEELRKIEKALQEAWNALSISLFEALIESITRRI